MTLNTVRVRNTLRVGGTPARGKTVLVELGVSAFDAVDQVQVLGAAVDASVTSQSGDYVFTLTPNSALSPAGTFYRVVHPNGERLSFVVPGGAEPTNGFWLPDLLVEDPAVPGPYVAGVTDDELSTRLDGFVSKSAAVLGYFRRWQPVTDYSSGDLIVSPSGHVMTAPSNTTSGAVFDATLWNPLEAWYPEMFGALGDNAHDDTAAIQACCDAAFARAAATGAKQTVRGRPGAKYLLNTVSVDGVTRWHIKGTGDDVHFEWDSSEFVTTSTAANLCVFLFNGAGRTGGAGAMNYLNWATRSATYPITPQAVKGQQVIPVQNAGDESHFAVGDWVLLRAGQCVPQGIDQPDGELNRVVAVDTVAHTITLKWPTSKPYQVEYKIAAGNNQTSTAVTGFGTTQPAIANVQGKIGRNVTWRGGKFTAPVTTFWVYFLHYFDSHADDVRGVFDGGMVVHQICRRLSQTRIRGERTGTTNTNTCIAAGVATCTNDAEIGPIWVDGNLSAIHLHEGAAQINVRGVYMSVIASDPAQGYGLSIAARLYDYAVSEVFIKGGNGNSPVTIDQYSSGGGTLTNVHAAGPAVNSFSVQAANVLLVGCDPGAGSYVLASGSKWVDEATALTTDSTGRLPATQLPSALQSLFAWAATFPGLAGNYFSTPDSAAASITGDLELRVKVIAGTSNRPASQQAFVAKYGAAGNISYVLTINTAGQLGLSWSENGTTVKTASSGGGTGIMPATFAQDTWIRVQLSVAGAGAAYTVKFFTSVDKVTWTQAGATVTGTAVTSIFDGTQLVEIGSTNTGALNLSTMTLAQVEIANVLGGAAVLHWQSTGPSGGNYVSPTGETWTPHGTSLSYTAGGGVQTLISGSRGTATAAVLGQLISALASAALVVDGTTA